MAKLVACYTLAVAGVTGLFDFNGIAEVTKPEIGKLYACMDDNAGIAGGSLYVPTGGTFDPLALDEAIKNYSAPVVPPANDEEDDPLEDIDYTEVKADILDGMNNADIKRKHGISAPQANELRKQYEAEALTPQ